MSSILRDPTPSLVESRPQLPRHLGRINPAMSGEGSEESLPVCPRRVQRAEEPAKRGRVGSVVVVLEGGSAGPRVLAPCGIGSQRTALVAVVLMIGVWWGVRDRPPEAPAPGRPGVETQREETLVAILPLQNLGEAEDEYFAAGVTDEIMSRLATVKGLGIISSGSTSRYADGDALPDAIGKQLGADFVLLGTVRWARQGDGASRVRISPRLIRVEDNVHLWAEVYDRTMDDIFAIQSEIAISVAQELGATPARSSARGSGEPTHRESGGLPGRISVVEVHLRTWAARRSAGSSLI